MNPPTNAPTPAPLPNFDDVSNVQESWKLLVDKEGFDLDKILAKTMRPKLMELSMEEPLSNVSSHDDDLLNDARTFDPLLDLKPQLLFSMLDKIIPTLGPSNEELQQELTDLGVKHNEKYGVTQHDYDVLCKGLCWTLQHHLKDLWNKDLETSWKAFYDFLATTMMQGAEQKKLKEKEERRRAAVKTKKKCKGKVKQRSTGNVVDGVNMLRPPKSPSKKTTRPSFERLNHMTPNKPSKPGIRGLLSSPLKMGRENACSPICHSKHLMPKIQALDLNDNDEDATSDTASVRSNSSSFSLKLPKLRRPSLTNSTT